MLVKSAFTGRWLPNFCLFPCPTLNHGAPGFQHLLPLACSFHLPSALEDWFRFTYIKLDKNCAAAEKNVDVTVDLAGCQNYNFGSSVTHHRACWIEWNGTVLVIIFINHYLVQLNVCSSGQSFCTVPVVILFLAHLLSTGFVWYFDQSFALVWYVPFTTSD